MPDRGPGTGTNYEKRKSNTTFPSEIPVMLKRRPCRLQTVDCADRADRADCAD